MSDGTFTQTTAPGWKCAKCGYLLFSPFWLGSVPLCKACIERENVPMTVTYESNKP